MASSDSWKKIVLKKYRTKLRSTLSQCIEDVLPDLESSGAIGADQRDKVREYIEGKMPANAVDYLMDDHMTKPLSDEGFMKLLGVMKTAPKCSPQCKALATVVEQNLTSNDSRNVDEVTKMLESLAVEKSNQIQELIDERSRWRSWRIICRYIIDKYEVDGGTKEKPLSAPLFVAKGPDDELLVRDFDTKRLLVFTSGAQKFKYSYCFEWKGVFKNITGIAVGLKLLYVADCFLHCIGKLQKFDDGGESLQLFGNYGNGQYSFNSPNGIAFDEGNSLLYVCDTDNHRIQIISEDNEILKFKSFEIPCASKGHDSYPKDILLNKAKDRLYITDQPNNRILEFHTTGELVGVFATVLDPFGICNYVLHIGAKVGGYDVETVVISSKSHNVVYIYDFDGKCVSTLIHDSYKFDQPCGVVAMNNGQIVVASVHGNRFTVI